MASSLFLAPLGEGLDGRGRGAPPLLAHDPLVGFAHEAHEFHDADEAEPDAEAHQAAHVGHEAGGRERNTSAIERLIYRVLKSELRAKFRESAV